MVNATVPGPFPQRILRALVALALSACVGGNGTLAGQASTSFRVSVTVQPPTGSCTAAVEEDGQTRVDCRPAVIVGAGAGASPAGGSAGAAGYRLPARVKLAGAVVETGEESFLAWGEYSSRLVVAGDIEYVEMTVTW